MTVCKSGSNTDKHFVTLLMNPEAHRNKSNFEKFVSRLTELKQPISVIAVDFFAVDIKNLCDFLDKGIPKLIEIGSIQSDVKLYLPLSFLGNLKMLQIKHNEIKKTEKEHLLKDVEPASLEDEFLYINYGVDVSDNQSLKVDSEDAIVLKRSTRIGINIQLTILSELLSHFTCDHIVFLSLSAFCCLFF
jgi:hypothetical protein